MEQGVREAMMAVGDSGSCVQLLAPLSESSTIAKFIDRNGPGCQQIAYRVTDVEQVAAIGFENQPHGMKKRRFAYT